MFCQSALFRLQIITTEEEEDFLEDQAQVVKAVKAVGPLTPELAQVADLETLKASASESPETAMANLNMVGINNLHRHVMLYVIRS